VHGEVSFRIAVLHIVSRTNPRSRRITPRYDAYHLSKHGSPAHIRQAREYHDFHRLAHDGLSATVTNSNNNNIIITIGRNVDQKLNSLARAVSRGRKVSSWAVAHHTPVDVAGVWCALPEVRDRVDTLRLQAAERMSGKLLTRSASAIKEVHTALKRCPDYPVKLVAGRTLVDHWLRVSTRFEHARKVAELKSRVALLEQKANARNAR
jgi:hypothetical protein